MEIRTDGGSDEWLHCPYCVGTLSSDSRLSPERLEEYRRELSIRSFMERRKVREALVGRLHAAARGARCDMCHQPITEDQLLMIRHTESFRCPRCDHDPADAACHKEAYKEERWLSVISALKDRLSECPRCCYLGAMARACGDALSRFSASNKHEALFRLMLAGKDWQEPEADCYPSCNAVQQYIALPGAGMVLLANRPD